MELMDLLGVGRERAITRQELCIKMGLPDRAVRRQIAEARHSGVLIINSCDGTGYYISDDPAELHRQYKTNENRAKAILAQQKHIARKLREIEQRGQITFEV